MILILYISEEVSYGITFLHISIVNEGIGAILNLFIFFLREDFTRTKSVKSTKSIKRTKSTKTIKRKKSKKHKKRKKRKKRRKHKTPNQRISSS